METFYCKNILELKREKNFLEKKLNIKIRIKGKKVLIYGDSIEEYEFSLVLDAINLGYSAKTAALLTEEDIILEKINIKDFTRRKNLEVVRGRLIGTHGRTKRTIEQISGCEIAIKDNTVGIIGPAESIEYALTAITNLIRGTKQTNIYKYLERINAKRKISEK
ncbi:MAG: hypothetical protein IIA87_02880 [Nanoarchaeota archaeon]|nr:hypothetical protein [Nanoarchaeota archaeon]